MMNFDRKVTLHPKLDYIPVIHSNRKTQEEPDIDNLMKIVEESMSAYKACKSRVDAVQQALNETIVFSNVLKIIER